MLPQQHATPDARGSRHPPAFGEFWRLTHGRGFISDQVLYELPHDTRKGKLNYQCSEKLKENVLGLPSVEV